MACTHKKFILRLHLPIIAADSTGGWFEVTGDDVSSLSSGDPVRVYNSTANDGEYTVASTSYDSESDRTRITVNESVVDNSANGILATQPDDRLIDCAACCVAVETTTCPDDATACAYGKAKTNGHSLCRSYYRSEYDSEVPRFENTSVDVTADRFVEEMRPRPVQDPHEKFQVFNLQEGDERVDMNP